MLPVPRRASPGGHVGNKASSCLLNTYHLLTKGKAILYLYSGSWTAESREAQSVYCMVPCCAARDAEQLTKASYACVLGKGALFQSIWGSVFPCTGVNSYRLRQRGQASSRDAMKTLSCAPKKHVVLQDSSLNNPAQMPDEQFLLELRTEADYYGLCGLVEMICAIPFGVRCCSGLQATHYICLQCMYEAKREFSLARVPGRVSRLRREGRGTPETSSQFRAASPPWLGM